MDSRFVVAKFNHLLGANEATRRARTCKPADAERSPQSGEPFTASMHDRGTSDNFAQSVESKERSSGFTVIAQDQSRHGEQVDGQNSEGLEDFACTSRHGFSTKSVLVEDK
jgi:hypothetical protein